MNDAHYRFDEAAVSLQKEKTCIRKSRIIPRVLRCVIITELWSLGHRCITTHDRLCLWLRKPSHRCWCQSAQRRLCGGRQVWCGRATDPRIQRERRLLGHGAASAGLRWAGRGAGVSRLHFTAAQIHGQRRESPSMHLIFSIFHD